MMAFSHRDTPKLAIFVDDKPGIKGSLRSRAMNTYTILLVRIGSGEQVLSMVTRQDDKEAARRLCREGDHASIGPADCGHPCAPFNTPRAGAGPHGWSRCHRACNSPRKWALKIP
jgi:hypothetical protein